MDLRHALMGGGHEEERDRLEELREQETREIELDDLDADKETWMQDDELVSLWHTFQSHIGWTGDRKSVV